MFKRRLANWLAGRQAERLACRHLKRAGFRIVETNVRVGRDEIDIVAIEDEVVVFVEVKRRLDSLSAAILALDAGKRRRLRRAVQGYLTREGLREVRHRIDLAAVSREEKGWRVVHIRDPDARP